MTSGVRRYSGVSTSALILFMLLRVAIGWHFAYEGLLKVTAPGRWTSAGYLKNASGPLKDTFHWLAEREQQGLLRVVDLLNSWGMLAAGMCFMVGLLTRTSGIGLMLMLAMFYLSQPPWTGMKLAMEEGNYIYVNKNVIEFFAIAAVIASGVSRLWGLDSIFGRRKRTQSQTSDSQEAQNA